MSDRAYLEGERGDGTFKWCVFPCQKRDENGVKIKRECRVSVKPHVVIGGHSWDVKGPADAPTLSPSINCEPTGDPKSVSTNCWHGFIVDGEVR